MLPADFDKLVVVLRRASFAVKRLGAKRNAPNDYRKSVEQLNWKTQPIILDEILVLRNAAVQVVQALADPDIKQAWNNRVPWATIYRHAANAVGWLDKFQNDITEYVQTQDPKLSNSVAQYERYKLTMINSIDDAFGKVEPVQPGMTRRGFLGQAAGILGLFAASAAGIYTPKVFAEEPKVMADAKPKEVDISDFTDDVAKKLSEKYNTGKEVLDDKEFAGKAQFSYESYEDGKSGFAKFLETAKADTYLILACDFTAKDNPFSKRATIAAKYLSDKFGLPLRILESKKEGTTPLFKNLANKYNSPISDTTFFLVNRYDVVTGETKEKNDGKLKIVDVIYGGPRTDDVIDSLVRDIGKYWLPTNIFAPNGEYVWRAEDRKMDNPWKKIPYISKVEK